MFSNLLKRNSLSNWNSKNDIIFAKTLNEESEWIITSKSLINYFKNTVGRKFYANTLIDAINNLLEEDEPKRINIVAHGSPGFIDIGNGYNSLTLEKELSLLKNSRKLNEHEINLWSCYGGSVNGIRDSLERCLNLKVNAINGLLGKGKSLEGITHSKLTKLTSNLPEYLTNGLYQYITRNYTLSNSSSGIPGDDSSVLGTPITYTKSINENNTTFANNYSPALIDYFRIRWETYIRIPETGTYIFSTSTDDGQILKVYENNQSGTLLRSFTDWNLHGTQTRSTSSISLTAGDVVFLRFDFFENRGGATARLHWTKNGVSETIPIGDMYLTESDAIGSDTTAPTIAITSDASSLKAGETTTVTFTLSEASSDFIEDDISVSGGELSSFASSSSTVYTATFTPTADSTTDGVISVASSKFSDSAGNENADGSEDNNSLTLSVDTVRPTIAITSDASSLKAGETTTVTFTLSEASSDFIEDDISVSGGELSSFASSSSTVYTATFTPTADSTTDGVISVASSKFSDSAGNENADGSEDNNSLTLSVDTVRPTIAITSDASSLKAGETTTVTFTLSEASSDFIEDDISVSGGELSSFASSSSTVYTATFTPTADSTTDGVISVDSSKFSDSAGNENADGSDSNNTLTLSVDTVLPTLSGSNPIDDEIDIFINSEIKFTFSEIVNVESGNIIIYDSSDNIFETIDVTGSKVTGDGTTEITAKPSKEFAELTSYYVQIADTAFNDVNGNSYSGISDKISLSFKTAHETSIATFLSAKEVTWSLPSGDDISRFRIDSSSGELFFANPTLENTTSFDGDNEYVVVIRSTEDENTSVDKTIKVAVGDNHALDVSLHQTLSTASTVDISATSSSSSFRIYSGEEKLTKDIKDYFLEGKSGNDKLYGGSGKDKLYGESGNDYLKGGSNSDKLYGGSGKDTLFGEDGDDYLKGGTSADKLYGGSGKDILYGESGDDYLKGHSGDDKLYGGSGKDYLRGGDGNDELYGGSSKDKLKGEDLI
ncbi:Ig-like domain-containing protein [Prochlorococcus marinus]|uniref:Ig-like domain-containing protein n=1 Tax=Prochlorococcus marinus TaxID=1219 RepID=UPI0039B50C86